MLPPDPGLPVDAPQSILLREVKFDFRALFKSLAKGIGHIATAKWMELGQDAADALAAIGLSSKPGELGFILIRRASILAMFSLV